MPPVTRPISYRPIEFTEYYAPDGTRLRFDNHYRFMLLEEGFGMPPIDYLRQRAPLQHGETIYDYRLQPRIIQLVLREGACNRSGYWDARANLLDIIRPNRQYLNQFELGVLRKILPDGSKRDINVIIEEGPSFPGGDLKSWDKFGFTDTLRFIAPDPTFFDPTLHEAENVAVAETHLVLPFTFDGTDIVLADATSYTGATINYTGTWMSYPVIIVTGPVDEPVIHNFSTGESIDLSAYDISAGDVVTLDLAFGNKTVVSSINGNIIRYVGPESDLATLAIVPDPTATGGVNVIGITGANQSPGVTSVLVRYYTRYIAI